MTVNLQVQAATAKSEFKVLEHHWSATVDSDATVDSFSGYDTSDCRGLKMFPSSAPKATRGSTWADKRGNPASVCHLGLTAGRGWRRKMLKANRTCTAMMEESRINKNSFFRLIPRQLKNKYRYWFKSDSTTPNIGKQKKDLIYN